METGSGFPGNRNCGTAPQSTLFTRLDYDFFLFTRLKNNLSRRRHFSVSAGCAQKVNFFCIQSMDLKERTQQPACRKEIGVDLIMGLVEFQRQNYINAPCRGRNSWCSVAMRWWNVSSYIDMCRYVSYFSPSSSWNPRLMLLNALDSPYFRIIQFFF